MRRHDASDFLHGGGYRKHVEFRAFEVFRQPTLYAEVVVMVLEVWIEANALPSRTEGGDQPEAVEEPQRPVHGVEGHRRNPRSDAPEDGFRIGMLRAPSDLAENLDALVRELYASLLAGGPKLIKPPPNRAADGFHGQAPNMLIIPR